VQFIVSLPEGKVSGDALRQLVVGATMTSTDEGTFSYTFFPDGHAEQTGRTYGGNPRPGGRANWHISGDELCLTNATWWGPQYQGGYQFCRSFTKQGGKIIESHRSREATFTR
jgi:hypothetical protein